MKIHHRIWSSILWILSRALILSVFISSMAVSCLLAVSPFILWNLGIPSESEMKTITGKVIWSFGTIGTLVYVSLVVLLIKFAFDKISNLLGEKKR